MASLRNLVQNLSRALVLVMTFSSMTAFALSAAPADVTGLKAKPSDRTVTLNWDAATDDQGVTGYYVYAGLSSVEQKGDGFYTYGSTDVGNVTQYVYTGLSNDVTYYFAVTAYDAEGQESAFYSNETEATPSEAETVDVTAPKVLSVDALANTMVELEFSEDVVLPKEGGTAFSIESATGDNLAVVDAYVSNQDASHVFVVTSAQTEGTRYILTAGISVEDAAGNPIVSGTSDTAVFTGTATVATDTPAPTDAAPSDRVLSADDEFTLESVDVVSETELLVTFSSEVGEVSADSFLLEEDSTTGARLEILAATISEDDAHEVTLLTEKLGAGTDYVLTADDTLTSTAGFTLSDAKDARKVPFTAPTLDLADLVPPEDVTAFLSKFLDENSVALSWTASQDSAGDLAKYFLYQKGEADTTYADPITLAKNLTAYTVDGLTPGATYTFKVTAVDGNGNESKGVTSTVTLPEAGPEMWGFLALSMMGGLALTRRKSAIE